MYSKILLTSDGSKNSEFAIQHALQIASDEGAEVIVLHVVDNKHLSNIHEDEIGQTNFDEYTDKVLNHFEQVIKELEDKKDEKFRVKIRKLALQGRPCDVIIKVCNDENIDMIVMSNSGKNKVDRFLLGSVTEKIIREAPVPVLVIPANYSPN
ncbi:universal stress protein [Methanosphaera sp.]|uniref:universal stress protein n=1 Tax=Methanosphaera sp. TaxID=2666342 RepID=UPI002E79074F|nr:universal stress protein [Methanosphaera sp.]MEE1117454.1 universal stress protein [Methanosphaera sp.]MEE3418244.1 universal stress protein [Methanosphaera sp.]